MDSRQKAELIAAGNIAKRLNNVERKAEVKERKEVVKEKRPEMKVWSDEELIQALNKAAELNKSDKIRLLTSSSSEKEILDAALNTIL